MCFMGTPKAKRCCENGPLDKPTCGLLAMASTLVALYLWTSQLGLVSIRLRGVDTILANH